MSEVKQGDFYIAEDECVACGVCHREAPDLFGWRDDGYYGLSYITRQPKTQKEVEQVFEAMKVCCVDCIYYRGEDTQIKEQADKIQEAALPRHCRAKPSP